MKKKTFYSEDQILAKSNHVSDFSQDFKEHGSFLPAKVIVAWKINLFFLLLFFLLEMLCSYCSNSLGKHHFSFLNYLNYKQTVSKKFSLNFKASTHVPEPAHALS